MEWKVFHGSYRPYFGMLFLCLLPYTLAIQQIYMDENCGKIVLVTSGAVVYLTSSSRYDPQLSCAVEILGTEGWEFMLKFRMLDIEASENCDTDSLQIYDGFKEDANVSSLTGKWGLCGEDAPDQTYLTTANKLTFLFTSDESLEEDGFMAVLTNYHNGACTNKTSEFRCDNGRCISREILCDSYNHCGDWSDEEVDCMFGLSKGTIIAIILGSTVLFIIVVGLVIFRTCSTNRSHRGHRTALGPVHFWGSPSGKQSLRDDISDDGIENPGYRERY